MSSLAQVLQGLGMSKMAKRTLDELLQAHTITDAKSKLLGRCTSLVAFALILEKMPQEATVTFRIKDVNHLEPMDKHDPRQVRMIIELPPIAGFKLTEVWHYPDLNTIAPTFLEAIYADEFTRCEETDVAWDDAAKAMLPTAIERDKNVITAAEFIRHMRHLAHDVDRPVTVLHVSRIQDSVVEKRYGPMFPDGRDPQRLLWNGLRSYYDRYLNMLTIGQSTMSIVVAAIGLGFNDQNELVDEYRQELAFKQFVALLRAWYVLAATDHGYEDFTTALLYLCEEQSTGDDIRAFIEANELMLLQYVSPELIPDIMNDAVLPLCPELQTHAIEELFLTMTMSAPLPQRTYA
jgi:hypothetical protein